MVKKPHGFARTGQTMLNVTDSKIIRLFVDDEPFGVASANIRHYERRLNMKSGTLDRERPLGNVFQASKCDQVPAPHFLSTAPCGGNIV